MKERRIIFWVKGILLTLTLLKKLITNTTTPVLQLSTNDPGYPVQVHKQKA